MRVAPAGREIQGAVIADDDIGDVQVLLRRAFDDQTLRGDKNLRLGRVGGAGWLQVNGEDSAIGPVEGVDGLLVFHGELGADAVAHAGRRTDADIEEAAEAIEVEGRPNAGARTPAELRRARAVVEANGTIPRHAPVPFHVAIEGEQLAIGIERDVVGVAETAEHQLPGLALRIGADDVAAGRQNSGRVAVAVPLSRQQEILAIVAQRRARRDPVRHRGVVAVHDVDLLVWAKGQAVRSMFAAAVEFLQEHNVVVLVRALRVRAAIQAKALGADAVHIKAVEGVQHSHRAADGELELLDIGGLSILEGDAQDRLVLLTRDNQPALVVLGHADPRPLGFGVRGMDEVDLESVRHVERIAGACRRLRLACVVSDSECGGRRDPDETCKQGDSK